MAAPERDTPAALGGLAAARNTPHTRRTAEPPCREAARRPSSEGSSSRNQRQPRLSWTRGFPHGLPTADYAVSSGKGTSLLPPGCKLLSSQGPETLSVLGLHTTQCLPSLSHFHTSA